MSKLIAAQYDRYNEWETQMPGRYRQYTGIENADEEDIQQMRRNVANNLSAFITSRTGVQQPSY